MIECLHNYNQPYLPHDIYTDASIRNNTKSVIHLLRDWIIIESAAAVDVTSDPMDPQTPVFGLQLYSEDDNLCASSYTMEMIALAQATQLCSMYDSGRVIYTDSLI
jgi:hypothetical protein